MNFTRCRHQCIWIVYIPRWVHVSSLVPTFFKTLNILIDPPVYPTIELYPPAPELVQNMQSSLSPSSAKENAEISTRVDLAYPVFDLCESNYFQEQAAAECCCSDPPVYPYFDLYNLGPKQGEDGQSLLPSQKYPAFDICELTPMECLVLIVHI
jgi:hypothetical protein